MQVFLKHEGENERGEAFGPCVVVAEGESTTRPYRPRCRCDRPKGGGGSDCEHCGRFIPEPWVSEADAKAIAAEHGVPLQIV